ncbi:MAG: hypothetical protein FWB74_04965 [Defluviitaleaceae bacterium]|nr:hypothetical protein [Defluviitaleaceae bacterium]
MDMFEMRDRVGLLPKYQRQYQLLKEKVANKKDEIKRLKGEYEGTGAAIDKMIEGSLSGFLLRLVGRYENRLDKLSAAEVEEKLAYDRAKIRLLDLEQELIEISGTVIDLQKLKEEFNNELDLRRKHLGLLVDARLIGIDAERSRIYEQFDSINGALRAADAVLSTASLALGSLHKARSWASWDVWTKGGFISHAVKYSHMDDTETHFFNLSSQLKRFNAYTKGIKRLGRNMQSPEFGKVSDSQRAVDLWFSNIFTSLSVRGQIDENIDNISRLLQQMDEAKNSLSTMKSQVQRLYDEIKEREEELLVSTNL